MTGTWMLIVLLCHGFACAQSTIGFNEREVCTKAAGAIDGRYDRAYCINRQTGEVVKVK